MQGDGDVADRGVAPRSAGDGDGGDSSRNRPEGHDLTALDGELIPPSRGVRRHYSNAEEIELGGKIRAEHESGERAAKEAVKHFRRGGEMLLKAKAELAHGHFALFLRERVKIHPRTAQRYMMLAREMAKLPSADATRVSQMSLRDAIGELVRTTSKIAKLPAKAVGRALKDARREPIKVAVTRATNNEIVRAAAVQARPAPLPVAALPSLDDEADESTGLATPQQVAEMQARLDRIVGQRPTAPASQAMLPPRPATQHELMLQTCSLLHRLREVSEKISGADLYTLFQGKFVNDLNLSLMPAAGLIGELLQAHSRVRVRAAQALAEQNGIEIDDATAGTFAAVLKGEA